MYSSDGGSLGVCVQDLTITAFDGADGLEDTALWRSQVLCIPAIKPKLNATTSQNIQHDAAQRKGRCD